jgi:acyl-CoA hydrolase
VFILNNYGSGKPAKETAIESENITLLEDAYSANSVIFGGRILDLIHLVALKVANNHADIECTINGIDFIRYFSPIKKEDVLICKAQVNRVWDDIIEIGVKVIAEDFRSLDKRHVMSAYFTFTLKEEDKVHVISQVIPESDIEKRRFLEAEKRKKIRKKRLKNKLK